MKNFEKGPVFAQEGHIFDCYKEDSRSMNSLVNRLDVELKVDETSKLGNFFSSKEEKPQFRRIKTGRIAKVQNQLLCPPDRIDPLALRALKIKALVGQFVRNLQFKSYVLPASLRKQVEQSHDFTKNQNISQEEEQIANHSKQPSFLRPGSKILQVWDLNTILFTLYGLWLCPFVLSFKEFDNSSQPLFIIAQLVLDALLQVNRGAVVQGQIITTRKVGIQKLQEQGAEFLIILVGWLLIFTQQAHISVFFILIIATLRRLFRGFSVYLESVYLTGGVSYAIDLMTIIIQIFFFAHIAACFWHFIAQQKSDTKNWILKHEIEEQSYLTRYNYSFYWATMTMVTVGYGDITPQNEMEMLYANVIMFFSSCIFAYSVNSIGMILKTIYDSELLFTRSLINITNYMNKNKVETTIQTRVRNFLKYKHEIMRANDSRDGLTEAISQLPQGLQQQLKVNINQKIIQSISCFGKFSKETQQKLTEFLQNQQVAPGDIVYSQNDHNEHNLYFIREGGVTELEKRSNRVFQNLDAGETFGEYQFFTGFSPQTTIVALEFTTLYFISRNRFLEILKANASDFEKFHALQHQIIYLKQYNAINLSCKLCKSISHLCSQCSLIQYIPDIEQRILVDSKSLNLNACNQREEGYPRGDQRINSRNLAQYVKWSVIDYIQKQGMSQNNIPHSPLINDQKSIQEQTIREKRRQSIRRASHLPVQTSLALSYQVSSSQQSRSRLQSKIDSTHTIEPQSSNFNILQDESLELSFHKCDIDKMRIYTDFLPEFNVHNTLAEQKRGFKNRRLFNKLNAFNKYTWSYQIKLLIYKIYQFLHSRSVLR